MIDTTNHTHTSSSHSLAKDRLKRLNIEVTEQTKRRVLKYCAIEGVSLRKTILKALLDAEVITKEIYETNIVT